MLQKTEQQRVACLGAPAGGNSSPNHPYHPHDLMHHPIALYHCVECLGARGPASYRLVRRAPLDGEPENVWREFHNLFWFGKCAPSPPSAPPLCVVCWEAERLGLKHSSLWVWPGAGNSWYRGLALF